MGKYEVENVKYTNKQECVEERRFAEMLNR
jgi:hypothetical protein